MEKICFISWFMFLLVIGPCQNYGLFDKLYNKKSKKTDIYGPHKENFPKDPLSKLDTAGSRRSFNQGETDEEVSEDTCFKEKAMILYYNFEKQKHSHSRVPDKSGCDNHGVMDVGSMIFSEGNSSCGSAAYLWSHDIKIIASSFQNPPKTGLSVSMWVKLIWSNGVPKELFSVNGPHFGVLSLRVDMDSIVWSYRRPNNSIVFSVVAYEAFPHFNIRKESNYTHIAATYNTLTGVSQVYLNGRILNRTVTSVTTPFSYWGNNINIGGNFRGMPFKGTVDEIKMFNYALDSASIDVLGNECHFGPSKDNFEIFKRSTISNRANIPKDDDVSDTLEKDSLTSDTGFDDNIYKDSSNYDEEFSPVNSSNGENDGSDGDDDVSFKNNVYEKESEQSLSSFTHHGGAANGIVFKGNTDFIN